jgi:glycosyltransferase involved in cell wall biosynthesis/peptidoglycan/xylan/chitin deacetylase (PgdA/CDA1 family)
MKNSLVLIYHRVQDGEQDPQALSVYPGKFDAQIRYLKSRFSIISLREMVRKISAGEPAENHLAITFDDGYADNLYHAKPILEKYEVPATFFITAAMIGSLQEFWWDELERIFLTGSHSLKPLTVEIDGKEHSWDIPGGKSPHDVYKEIHRLLKYMPFEKREKIMDGLFSWAGLDRKQGRDSHRVLNRQEILELSKGNLVEIGSHTLNHPVLSVETPGTQWREIDGSRIILEQLTGKKIVSFSYPFGQKTDISPDTIRIVKQSGYMCGISNIQGNIDDKTDVYMIPRRIVRNWEYNELRHKLDEFLNINIPCSTKEEQGKKIALYLDHIESFKAGQDKNSPADVKRNVQNKKIQNILFINHLDKKGGAAQVCYRIFKNLEKKGFNTHILVKKKFSLESNITEIPEPGHEDQAFLTAFQEKEGWYDVFHYSSFNIKNLVEFQNADIVHLHNLHKNYFSLLALPGIARLKPVIWTLHDMSALTGRCVHSFDCERWETGCEECPGAVIEAGANEPNKGRSDMLWNLKKTVYEHSDFSIVCPSCWLESKVKKSILKDKETRVIYNGVDETVFKDYDKREARKQLGLPDDKLILLFVAYGGLELKIKGGHLIRDVIERLPQDKILFLSIGKAGIDMKNSRALPYIDDENRLALYYSAADLFLYPSLADNCPLVVLESLSCGTPVISFDTGGIPELVKHKETGYLADYNDLDGLVKGVEYFLNDPMQFKQAGINARRSVLEKFTLEKMIKGYLDVYESRYKEFFTRSHSLYEGYKEKITGLLNTRLR